MHPHHHHQHHHRLLWPSVCCYPRLVWRQKVAHLPALRPSPLAFFVRVSLERLELQVPVAVVQELKQLLGLLRWLLRRPWSALLLW